MMKTLKICSVNNLSFTISKYFHIGLKSSFMNVRDPAVEKKTQEVTIIHENIFDKMKEKNKKAFNGAIDLYITKNNVHRRGHVEFLYAAISKLSSFMAHRDINTYRKLLEVFPRYKMIPQNIWQQEFMHYPKQQQCCIDILDYMESHGVVPDDEFGYQMLDIFGDNSHAFRKYRRMMYWMPKFKYANPYYIPYDLPDDLTQLAELVLRRMCPDLNTHITHFQTENLKGAEDKTFIVSAQSPTQQQLLANIKSQEMTEGQHDHVVVEGGFRAWARMACMNYFVLKSEVNNNSGSGGRGVRGVGDGGIWGDGNSRDDETCEWKLNRDHERPSLHTFNEHRSTNTVELKKSVHEQDDGTILAMAITGTSSKDSLVSWVKFLEATNPTLSSTPVLFQLTHQMSTTALQNINQTRLPKTQE